MSAVCFSRARLAVWGMVAHGGAADSGALEVGSPGRAVAESETNKRLPWSATAFSFVAAKIRAERRFQRLASQLLATAFSFAAPAFEAVKWCPRQQSQFLTAAFSPVGADFGGPGQSPLREFQRLATAFSFVAGDFGADRRLL